MKHKGKISKPILTFSITFFFIIALLPIVRVSAQTAVIYEKSVKKTVTTGVTLENMTKFTDDGWLDINVLRADTANPNVRIDTMSGAESVRNLSSLIGLSQSKKAVAAVNGSFFIWSATPGLINPIGPIVDSRVLKTVNSELNNTKDTMATFSIGISNEILYNYWKTDMSLMSPNGVYASVGRYNKPFYGYTDLTVIDRKWGSKSVGMESGITDIVEMVVDGDKVVEIRQSLPAVEIPANGYVVVTKGIGGQFIYDNFNVGDTVGFQLNTTPDWTKIRIAVSGGAMLVKDGKVVLNFSHNITGRNPRTAIGSTKDGKQVIMVTVDGRQNDSIGMTQTELAELMLSLGAYNALNLDGGGSTAMIARPPGAPGLKVINDPSDGAPRRISTAIGIISTAPSSKLKGLIIETNDINIFMNTSRIFTVKGYDAYFNSVMIKPEQVKWSISGIEGSFKGNTFYPKTKGEGKIRATVGTVSAVLAISSLSSPVQLELSKKSIELPVNGTGRLSVIGKNRNGYHADINPSDVKWSVNGGVGSFKTGVFTAKIKGVGYIDASVGGTHAYCTVSVISYTSSAMDTFEAVNGSFAVYPDTVAGSYEISAEQKHSGLYSGKLNYDFNNNIENTRAAYLVFPDSGPVLQPDSTKIGLWVYNTHENSNWLRSEIYDKNGNKFILDLAKGMYWTGWKFVEASLGKIDLPANLARLYLVQADPVPDSGSVYLDDLTVTIRNYIPVDMSKIPQDTVPVDETNKSITYRKSSDSFRFSVFGESREPVNLLEKIILRRLSEKTNQYLDASAFVGNNPHNIAGSIKKPVISVNTGYKSFDMKNSRFIQLDTSKHGIRTSGIGQWQWFRQQLDSFKGANVFIFLAGAPQDFSDDLEAGLLQDILTGYRQKTGKNIWVFYKSDKNASYMERGIKYITLAGLDIAGLKPENTDVARYLLVTVKGSGITFQFRPII